MPVITGPGIHLEKGLLEAVGRGDPDAFRTLYKQTGKPVYAYALSILHNPQDAEDATEDTFLKIREAAHLYTSRGKPMAWIFTIARNICMMKLRKSQNEGRSPTEAFEQQDPFDGIQNREDRIVLKTAMEVLSQEEFQIILLHAVTGLKHREISELREMPLSTVLSKYNRGIKKLRTRLEDTSCLTSQMKK